jgi:hypothetical protein
MIAFALVRAARVQGYAAERLAVEPWPYRVRQLAAEALVASGLVQYRFAAGRMVRLSAGEVSKSAIREAGIAPEAVEAVIHSLRLRFGAGEA